MARAESASTAGKNKGKLKVVVILTATYLFAEVAGGLWTGSLALLADAGHMLTDVGGLVLALLAIRMAEKPASPSRTYGYYRAEILAALSNAVVLIGISIFILYEAYERFRTPPEVSSGPMLAVAGVGLVVNIVSLLLLRVGSDESLNMKGAYFEVVSDLLTSIGVILAAIIMWATGWYYVDPLISAGIGIFILPRTWLLMKDAVSVLLEGTPSDVDIADLRRVLLTIPGVASVHDLHVWSITSGVNAMSAHVVKLDAQPLNELLKLIHRTVKAQFVISHLTVQVEDSGFEEGESHS